MKINKYILFAGLLIAAHSATAQQKEYEGKMHVTPLQLEQKGDSLYVKLLFDISGVNVDSRRSISLFPILVAPQKSKALPEVMVKGRNNYHTYERRVALMNKTERALHDITAPYAVVKGYKSDGARTIEYNKVIPYESWMADARMDIQEDLCGCGNAPRTLAMSQLINRVQVEILVEPYQIMPILAYVTPQVETIKRREMVGEAFLDFVVNKIDIRPEYMNNPRELKKITDMISEVNGDPSIIIKAINVDGNASPEGGYANNKYLSEGRANALVGYLIPRFNFPKDMYKVRFGGENWIGLKEMVLRSEIDKKEEILTILSDTNITDDQRKIRLIQLEKGAPYAFMLNEWYPRLRKASCKIEFEVKGFEVAQAKEIIKSRPQNLSLSEMFLVANTYQSGSQEFIDIFELAVRMYPDDQTANLNAASAALARNDIRSAERYLDRIKTKSRIPELDNAKGVLAMLKGDYDQAEQHLKAAAETGLEAAKKNIDELNKKRENIEAINKQKR